MDQWTVPNTDKVTNKAAKLTTQWQSQRFHTRQLSCLAFWCLPAV